MGKVQQRLAVAMWVSWGALAALVIDSPAHESRMRSLMFILPHVCIALTFAWALPRYLGDYLRCLVLGYVIKEREDQERRDQEASQAGLHLVREQQQQRR